MKPRQTGNRIAAELLLQKYFLAMSPKGGQTRKFYFLAMHVSRGGQTRKYCFLAMFSKGRQTRKHCFLAIFLEVDKPGNVVS